MTETSGRQPRNANRPALVGNDGGRAASRRTARMVEASSCLDVSQLRV